MPDQPRPLPGQPNLRYLKLEARRRLAAGEFSALHDAQLAIAREHGQPSWAALKQLIESLLDELDRSALAQLRWVISRFGTAGTPGWAAPADGELREHLAEGQLREHLTGDVLDRYLDHDMTSKAVTTLTRLAALRREGLVVVHDDPLHARARAGGLLLEAEAEPEPPHRLTRLGMTAVGRQVSDARVTAPPTSSSGAVPVAAAETAAPGFGELGLAGLVLAGGAPGGPGWAIARGWAEPDRAEPLRPDHRFPAYGITRLITATAVLRLIADERVGIDDPANDHLRTVRLADDAVTVRELLSHAGGVDAPDPARRPPAGRDAGTVPSVVSLYGSVLPCTRGRVRGQAPGDYAALWQLIADVTGSDYATAVTRLVLGPLGMACFVPGRLAARGPGRGHRLRAGIRRHLQARSRRPHRDPARGRPVDDRHRPGQVRHRVVIPAARRPRQRGAPAAGPGTHRPRLAHQPGRWHRLGSRRRPRREHVPDRPAQRQPRLRRADQPEGAHPGP